MNWFFNSNSWLFIDALMVAIFVIVIFRFVKLIIQEGMLFIVKSTRKWVYSEKCLNFWNGFSSNRTKLYLMQDRLTARLKRRWNIDPRRHRSNTYSERWQTISAPT